MIFLTDEEIINFMKKKKRNSLQELKSYAISWKKDVLNTL